MSITTKTHYRSMDTSGKLVYIRRLGAMKISEVAAAYNTADDAYLTASLHQTKMVEKLRMANQKARWNANDPRVIKAVTALDKANAVKASAYTAWVIANEAVRVEQAIKTVIRNQYVFITINLLAIRQVAV